MTTSMWQAGQDAGTGNPDLDRAAKIQNDAQTAYDRIRGNTQLSDVAKRQQIAKAYLGAQQALNDHKAAVDKRNTDQVTQLTRTAFGVPSDPIQAM